MNTLATVLASIAALEGLLLIVAWRTVVDLGRTIECMAEQRDEMFDENFRKHFKELV